ncbi:minichromosome maintenance domain-containing protein 2-like [Thalassophryne amazonica]|uniref:minichromosome maintenance domain-containing protein 2-like n=1 Tax=Thalassophryne amazonica TaxID=390379 RepID=UPI001470AA4C|nr:minichromosome maintenance domain-containing protein 2-like [Thalassophryne amazonica]
MQLSKEFERINYKRKRIKVVRRSKGESFLKNRCLSSCKDRIRDVNHSLHGWVRKDQRVGGGVLLFFPLEPRRVLLLDECDLDPKKRNCWKGMTVNIILKLTHLPPFPEYTLDLCTFPRGYGAMRPLSMEGLVIAMTRVTKYTQGARFLCINDDCPCSTDFLCTPTKIVIVLTSDQAVLDVLPIIPVGFHHIRVHAPGAIESATVRNDFLCLICSSPLKEDVKFRVLGDKQLVELIHVKALDILRAHQQKSHRLQSVTLFVRDELCSLMRIGRLYRVLGIPAHVHQWPNITWSVEANNIQPWQHEYPSEVSKSFQELFKASASSPWRFSAIVANCFGLDVVPPGLYNTLKLGLLLSLVQTRADAEDTFHNLDLFVLTTDTLIVDRLMTYSLSLSCRGVKHKVSGDLFACLSRDQHGTGTANIHAGSALLATGGICMLGDLGCYKRDKLDAIQSVYFSVTKYFSILESRTLSMFIPGKRYGEDVDQQLSFPVHCSFWALTDSTDVSPRSSRADCDMLGTAEMGSGSVQLGEAFGFLIQCQDTVGQQCLLSQAVHTLHQAVHPRKPLYPSYMEFTTQDYMELVAYAQGLQVEMSPGAEKMIHGYYMASRRVRSHLNQGVKMSVANVKLLISLAEAHCRLSLRSHVLEEDAVIAVLLCENAVTLRHGASALIVPPDAVFPCDVSKVDGLHRRDITLDELHQNILHFIYAYAPGADAYITEE